VIPRTPVKGEERKGKTKEKEGIRIHMGRREWYGIGRERKGRS
jgi:hypothetical protein